MEDILQDTELVPSLWWRPEESLPSLPPNCPVCALAIYPSIINSSCVLMFNVQLTKNHGHYSSHQVYLLGISLGAQRCLDSE